MDRYRETPAPVMTRFIGRLRRLAGFAFWSGTITVSLAHVPNEARLPTLREVQDFRDSKNWKAADLFEEQNQRRPLSPFEVIRSLLDAADRGDRMAQYSLGRVYDEG